MLYLESDCLNWYVLDLQKVLEYLVSAIRQKSFPVKLNAVNRVLTVFHSHYDTVIRSGGYLQTVRQIIGLGH